MKNEKDIKVEMVRVVGDLAPFVKIDYVDNDAQEHSGLLVVDSCSCHNILFGERASSLGLVYNPTDETISIGTIANTMVVTSVGKFAFTFEGGQFVEPFCISNNDNDIPNNVGDLPIIGILGNLFLQKYNLAIDYSTYTLHTSNVNPESLPISECDFFFPMEIGLKNYGLPILSLRQDGKEIIALADSGSTDNVLSSQVITELGFDCHYLETADTVTGVMGSVEAKDAVMSFCLLTLTEDDTDEVSHKDIFKVLPHTLISPEEGQCDENGNQLPPVVSLIGSPFMSRENWVLDFGAKIIYRRKADKPMNWNVRVRKQNTERVETCETEKQDILSEKSIRFYTDVLDKGMPFIQVKEGDFKDVIFLLDTGSNNNVLFGYACQQLKDILIAEEGQSDSFGIEGKVTTLKNVSGKLTFCGKEYATLFNVRENNNAIIKLSMEMGFPISGIIGTSFMAEYGWLIDFGKQEIIIPAYGVTSADLNNVRTKSKAIK